MGKSRGGRLLLGCWRRWDRLVEMGVKGMVEEKGEGGAYRRALLLEWGEADLVDGWMEIWMMNFGGRGKLEVGVGSNAARGGAESAGVLGTQGLADARNKVLQAISSGFKYSFFESQLLVQFSFMNSSSAMLQSIIPH